MQFCGVDKAEFLRLRRLKKDRDEANSDEHDRPAQQPPERPAAPAPEQQAPAQQQEHEVKELIEKNRQVLQLIEKTKFLEAKNRALAEHFDWANEQRKTWDEQFKNEMSKWEEDRAKLVELIKERDNVISELKGQVTEKTIEIEKKLDNLQKPLLSPRAPKESVHERLYKNLKKPK